MRFRGKIMAGFAVVLAISAASLGIAYLGFERVSAGVASYRNSVSEADLARNIDRELISYRVAGTLLCGDRQGGRRQGGAEGRGQPEGGHRPGDEGHQRIRRGSSSSRSLERNSAPSARSSPRSSRSSSESALVAQNQLDPRRATCCDYKLDDLASTAAEAELPAVEFGAKQVDTPVSGDRRRWPTPSSSMPTRRSPTSALARLKFVENALQRDLVDRRQDRPPGSRRRQASGTTIAALSKTGREFQGDRRSRRPR